MINKTCLTIMLSSLLTFALPAYAALTFQDFKMRPDGRYDLTLNRDGTEIKTSGTLRVGGKEEDQEGQLTIVLRSYSEGFITIVVTAQDHDLGVVFVLEKKVEGESAQYLKRNERAIAGRKTTLVADLDGSIDGLKKINNWDPAQALRAMVAYFADNPTRQLTDFYDQVELGAIKQVAKPQPKPTVVRSERPPVVQQPEVPAQPTYQRYPQQPHYPAQPQQGWPSQPYPAPQYQSQQYPAPAHQGLPPPLQMQQPSPSAVGAPVQLLPPSFQPPTNYNYQPWDAMHTGEREEYRLWRWQNLHRPRELQRPPIPGYPTDQQLFPGYR